MPFKFNGFEFGTAFASKGRNGGDRRLRV